jgi:hypothetical protein
LNADDALTADRNDVEDSEQVLTDVAEEKESFANVSSESSFS